MVMKLQYKTYYNSVGPIEKKNISLAWFKRLSWFYLPVAYFEYFGRKTPQVVCKEECPWQTIALMMGSLYLKINNINRTKQRILLIFILGTLEGTPLAVYIIGIEWRGRGRFAPTHCDTRISNVTAMAVENKKQETWPNLWGFLGQKVAMVSI